MQADIYDFEKVFEGASKCILNDGDLKAFTSRDNPDFQKDRPRVEVAFTLGPGRMQRPWIEQGDDQNPTDERESGWQGKMQFELITDADAKLHGSYLSRLRYLLSTFRIRANGFFLKYHSIGLVRDGGETRILAPQDGYYKTTLVRDIDFGVLPDAWPLLNENAPFYSRQFMALGQLWRAKVLAGQSIEQAVDQLQFPDGTWHTGTVVMGADGLPIRIDFGDADTQ